MPVIGSDVAEIQGFEPEIGSQGRDRTSSSNSRKRMKRRSAGRSNSGLESMGPKQFVIDST